MRRLPKGFTEVEYLESDGNAYIDTGIYRTNTGLSTGDNLTSFRFKGVVEYTSTGVRRLMGDNGSHNGFWGIAANNKFETGTTSTYTASVNTKYKIDFTATAEAMTLVVNIMDGTEVLNFSRSATVLTKVTNATFDVFALGGNFINSGTRVYKYQIYIDNKILGDYIPCLDSNNAPCMYDLVAGRPLYNAGTGNFTYGHRIIPIKYLEGSGTQYINTGIDTTTQMNVSVQFSYTQLNYYGILFDTQYPSKNYLGIRLNANNPALQVLAGNKLSAIGGITVGTKSLFDGRWNSSGGTFILDGVEYTVTDADLTPASGYPIYIFAGNQQNSPAYYCYAKIYYLKISNGTTLVRDYIPVRDENGVGYMFDTVTHTLYGNAGTGNFIIGEDLYYESNNKFLRKKLAMMLADLKKQRPYYCEVEYLESSGTQYIDTGVIYRDGYDVESYFGCNTTAASSKFLFGVYTAITNGQLAFSTYSGWGTSSATGIFYKYSGAVSLTNNTVNKVEFKNKEWYYNGTEYGYTFDFSDTVNLTMYLFAGNDRGNPNYNFIGKMYSFKMWDTQHNLIANFIPVLDWDMTPCMYDKVTGRLFYNAGTGDFTYGREIHPVEYIEGTGTQWIDTGVVANGEFDSKYKIFLPNGYTTNCIIAGARSSTQHVNFGQFETNGRFTLAYLGNYWVGSTSITSNQYYDIEVSYKSGSQTCKINGTSVTGASYTGTEALNMNIHLFKRNFYTSGDPTALFIGKLYYFQLLQNGKLVRDYTPAIDENGVGFMFDRVTHTCFLNQGTGVFKYPPRELEYLQSGGSQYINTGIDLATNDTLELNVDGSYVDLSSTYGQFFGVNGGAYFGVNTSNGFVVGSTTAVVTADTNRHTFKLESTIGNNKSNTLTIDGNTYTNTRNNATGTVYLYNLSQTSYGCKFKLYSSSIKKNGTLVRDFVPVYKNGTLGLFDKTNNVLYENIGAYSFVAGKIVEPKYE